MKTNKEALKKEIESLTDKEVEILYQYLTELKLSKKNKKGRNIPSFKLKGILDDQDIRNVAHDE